METIDVVGSNKGTVKSFVPTPSNESLKELSDWRIKWGGFRKDAQLKNVIIYAGVGRPIKIIATVYGVMPE